VAEVRAESPRDSAAVYEVNRAAFGRLGEAVLVDALREAGASLVSMVAAEDGAVVGHVLFSPVSVEPEPLDEFRAVGLAPLAVLPARQRRGVGSDLVESGIEECRRLGYDAIFVLGDPAYYRRFGFAPAAARGLRCGFPVPEEAFMVAELKPGALNGTRGLVRYLPEFDAL
jgi:putative acetyltransferase